MQFCTTSVSSEVHVYRMMNEHVTKEATSLKIEIETERLRSAGLMERLRHSEHLREEERRRYESAERSRRS